MLHAAVGGAATMLTGPRAHVTVSKVKSRSIHRYDAEPPAEVHTGDVMSRTTARQWTRPVLTGETPGDASWPGRAGRRTSCPPLPVNSLTIHGAPLGISRGLTRDPVARPPWAEAEPAYTGSAGTMTRAAVIAPGPMGDGAAGDLCKDARTLGTAAPKRTAAH